ncbi:hypothetical protein [Methylomonas sp. ZR1]|uniref:hypothetical protein n=1 Tax=Methylomonas sp. ZR1 TaxID=1797072 RepID=UPI001490AA5A|nr:hypothetical protein [Methylomonas sp. ZR1]NOV29672.1 hypothetical protein [Methylomonas sp. ZR1]
MIKAEQLGEKSVLFGIISALIYTAKQTYGGIVKDAGQETAVLATTVIILSIISLEFKLYETRKSINKSPISILIFLFLYHLVAAFMRSIAARLQAHNILKRKTL